MRGEDQFMEEARIHFREGRHSDALVSLQRALAVNVADARARHMRDALQSLMDWAITDRVPASPWATQDPMTMMMRGPAPGAADPLNLTMVQGSSKAAAFQVVPADPMNLTMAQGSSAVSARMMAEPVLAVPSLADVTVVDAAVVLPRHIHLEATVGFQPSPSLLTQAAPLPPPPRAAAPNDWGALFEMSAPAAPGDEDPTQDALALLHAGDALGALGALLDCVVRGQSLELAHRLIAQHTPALEGACVQVMGSWQRVPLRASLTPEGSGATGMMVWALIDGRRSAAEVCTASGLSRLHAAYVLAGFIRQGDVQMLSG